MDRKTAVEILREFNEWRRGEGKYEFSENPDENLQFPYTPKKVGKAIDFAVKYLETHVGKATRKV